MTALQPLIDVTAKYLPFLYLILLLYLDQLLLGDDLETLVRVFIKEVISVGTLRINSKALNLIFTIMMFALVFLVSVKYTLPSLPEGIATTKDFNDESFRTGAILAYLFVFAG